MQDVQLWLLVTELTANQQATAIVLQLQGAAREYARTFTADQLINGDDRNGVHQDPVPYVITSLHERFAQLEDETRLAAMTQFMAFQRYRGESINQVLSRYEIVRNRAPQIGNYEISVESLALHILRVCGVSASQMIELLQPLGSRMPRDHNELVYMCYQLRRLGHILENRTILAA